MKKPRPPAKRAQPTTSQQSGSNHTVTFQSHKWEAPLPPPSVLDEFNHVVPNGAERIVRAWELESEHRRQIERTEQRAYYRDMMTGKVFALIFVLAALGMAGFAAFVGAQWLGAILGTGTIASVVWAFVQRQKKPKT
jgi:uncharacterized membrane protein